jgi:hypothetical protein
MQQHEGLKNIYIIGDAARHEDTAGGIARVWNMQLGANLIKVASS